MANELLPCPFCGKRGYISEGVSKAGGFWAICPDDDCGAEVRGASSREEAVALWNRRAAREAEAVAVKPLLAELRDKLASLPEHDRGFSWESRDYRGNPAIRAYGDLANALYWVTQNSHAVADALASPAPHVAEGWRPIETAPKDGSLFLAIARTTSSRPWISQCKFVGPDARYPTAKLDWFMGIDGWPQPTHWMPLPAAPQIKEGEDK